MNNNVEMTMVKIKERQNYFSKESSNITSLYTP